MLQKYRTGQWDIASLCVVHIGIVLYVPWRTVVQEYRTGQWDLASLCVVHIGIVLHSPIMYCCTGVQDGTVGFS